MALRPFFEEAFVCCLWESTHIDTHSPSQDLRSHAQTPPRCSQVVGDGVAQGLQVQW